MNYNPFSLEYKIVLITGASSGIGSAVAIEFSKMGAAVVISGRNEKRLVETFRKLSPKDSHQYIVADLTTSEGLDLLVSTIPPIDGVVHCAGFLKKLPLKFIDEHAWNETLKINLIAPGLLSQKLIKTNKLKAESSVVFISSIASFVASIGNISYMASKGALNSFAKGMALEMAKKKIRVNIIEPALIKTNLSESALSESELATYLTKFPLGRFGYPEEVAYAAVFLISDASKWITGTSILIDGGVTLS